jgi:hypothetical protein
VGAAAATTPGKVAVVVSGSGSLAELETLAGSLQD